MNKILDVFTSVSKRVRNIQGLKFVIFNSGKNEIPRKDINVTNSGFYIFPAGNNEYSIFIIEI